MIRVAYLAMAVVGVLLFTSAIATFDSLTKSHALTLDTAPKYDAHFKHLNYVNPHAPKGGSVKLIAIGSYDTFHQYIIKGDPPAGISLIDDTLMDSSQDDNLSEYGLIAETVEIPNDLSFAIYNIRKEARFHDGSPITADDIVFSFHILKEQGRPFYRFYYSDVEKVEALTPHRVKFSFSGPPNRELPQIVAQIPILSKQYWSERDFNKTTLEPPLGNGPYKIGAFEPGRYIVYERVKDYWATDLPINKGRHNFDTMRYDFVQDQTVALEMFKAGEYDYRPENSSKLWATGYGFPSLHEGFVKKEALPHGRAVGMQGFFFNTRREKFQNRTIRKALGYAFDFEWSNKNLFHGQYHRTSSFYENSELAASMPPSPEELKILEPFRGKIPDEVFTTIYTPPTTDEKVSIRKNLQQAARLIREAGWNVKDGKLINQTDEKPLEIEFLLVSPAFERVVMPFIQNLNRLGVQGTIRTVDPAQYQNRLRSFDFDVVIATAGQSRSPGNEQRDFWGSTAAGEPGSRNMIGIRDPSIDALIEKIVAATDRISLVHATRALDRVLQWNHYVIPQWYTRNDRVAWWDKFGRPSIKPKYAVGFDSWWVDPQKVAAIEGR